jgi:hypothetical protein
MMTYVIDVSVRYGKRVKVTKAFSDAGHLKASPVVIRRLGSVSR